MRMADDRLVMPAAPKVRWKLVLAASLSGLFVAVGLLACTLIYLRPKVVDFLSYWAAGRLAASGNAGSAYDIDLHHTVERGVVAFTGGLPFPYPPPFLLVATPFALLPFSAAFAAWVTLTGGLYALVAGRRGALPYALSQPPVVANALIGQNGFLTTSIFAGGLQLLPRRPMLAGAIFGLLVIKPQLGILLPVALIAGREWRAIAGAALSAGAGLLLALLAFGPDAYANFLQTLPSFAARLAAGNWPWNEVASVYALVRFAGLTETVAMTAQVVIALIGAWLVWRAWRLKMEERGAILAAATLLVPPYLFTYDALLLAVPALWLLKHPRERWVYPVIWLLCFLPIANFFDLYPGPNTIPFAAMLCLWALHSRPITGHAA
jgi:hypothetical protein